MPTAVIPPRPTEEYLFSNSHFRPTPLELFSLKGSQNYSQRIYRDARTDLNNPRHVQYFQEGLKRIEHGSSIHLASLIIRFTF